MSVRDDPPLARKGVDWGAVAMLGGGLLSLGLGLAALIPFLRDLSARPPVVAFRPRDLIPLPLSLSFFSFFSIFSIVFLLQRDEAPRSRHGRPEAKRFWSRAQGRLYFAAGAAALAMAMPLIGHAAASRMLGTRGYTACPPADEPGRHAPYRWVRPGGRCP